MEQTQTQRTTIPGRSGQEQQLLQLLQQLAKGGMSQLGNLAGLAGGQAGRPTGEDLELIQASIGRAGQFAQQQAQTVGSQLQAQLQEQLASRGVSGSSAEVAGSLLNQLGTQQGINQAIFQAQQAGGEQLLNLPFQRGALQLQANQQLFQQILGAAGPALQFGLQERMAQPTQTVSQGAGLDQWIQLGQTLGAIGVAPFTGGASLAAMPKGQSSGPVKIPNQTGGYSVFDPSKFTGRIF